MLCVLSLQIAVQSYLDREQGVEYVTQTVLSRYEKGLHKRNTRVYQSMPGRRKAEAKEEIEVPVLCLNNVQICVQNVMSTSINE